MTKKKSPKASKKTKSTRAKAQKKSKLGVVNVKMSEADRKRLKAQAKRFAQGNLSAWLRHAGKVYTPKRGEKVSLKAA